MADISSFFKLHVRQNRRHSTAAEYDKEPFGANRFSLSLFANEIIKINGNSRWLPDGQKAIAKAHLLNKGELKTRTPIKKLTLVTAIYSKRTILFSMYKYHADRYTSNTK